MSIYVALVRAERVWSTWVAHVCAARDALYVRDSRIIFQPP